MTPFVRFGLGLAGTAMIADQISKWVMVELVFRPDGVTGTPFFTGRIIEVLPFFQFRLVWNPGISFSLFNSGEATTIALLIVFQLCVVGLLLWWLRQAETRMIAVGIGLIVGGALGNIADRIMHGAVVDFLDFHAAGYHFPTFNLADTFISIGVGFWLLDAFVNRPHHSANEKPANDKTN